MRNAIIVVSCGLLLSAFTSQDPAIVDARPPHIETPTTVSDDFVVELPAEDVECDESCELLPVPLAAASCSSGQCSPRGTTTSSSNQVQRWRPFARLANGIRTARSNGRLRIFGRRR